MKKNNEEIKLNHIAYLRYFNSFYKIVSYDTGVFHKFLRSKKNTKNSIQTDFFIPYENYGNVIDSYGFFDNFRFSEFGKIKKFIFILTIFLMIMSIYFLPKVIFYYALIYVVLYIMYLFYKGNKNYVRAEIFLPEENEITNIIYQFKTHKEKMSFLKFIKKHNNKFLKIKTDFSYFIDSFKKIENELKDNKISKDKNQNNDNKK